MQVWEVVGGREHGGILVRTNKEKSSHLLPHRLETGVLVQELEIVGDRLHFQRISGEGPDVGWVTLKTSNAELLVKRSESRGFFQSSGTLPDQCPKDGPNSEEQIENDVKGACSSLEAESNSRRHKQIDGQKAAPPASADLESDVKSQRADARQNPRDKAKNSGSAPTGFTKERGLEMMKELIAEFSKVEFQNALHQAWEAAGGDPMQQGLARQKVCLPIQIPIVARYGFEASKKGVLQSAMSCQRFRPDLNEYSEQLSFLVNPDLQKMTRDDNDGALTPTMTSHLAEKTWLENVRLDKATPIMHGAWVACSSAPLTIITASGEQSALSQYLREDAESPWAGLDSSDQVARAKETLLRWGFEVEAQNSDPKVYSATWHLLQGPEFQRRICVPGSGDSEIFRRAPVRLLSLIAAFREVNSTCWAFVVEELQRLKRKKPVNTDLNALVDCISELFKDGCHFGAVEAHLHFGSEDMKLRPSVRKVPTLLNLSLTLSGQRDLRIHVFQESGNTVEANDVWSDRSASHGEMKDIHMPTGSVHLFAPLCIEHGIKYLGTTRSGPIIALDCTLAFESLTAHQVELMNGSKMVQVAKVVADALRQLAAQRKLRLPSLQEVIHKQRAMRLEWLEFSSGSTVVSAYGSKAFSQESNLRSVDSGLFVGCWRYCGGKFDISHVRGELRWVEVQHGCKVRGTLRRDAVGSGHVAELSNGEMIRLKLIGSGEMQISRKIAASWSEAVTASLMNRHEIEPHSPLAPEVVASVREAALSWSVDWKCPPLEELAAPLNLLESCNCGPVDKRTRFLAMCSLHFKSLPLEPLVFVSFGSGGCWFEWWLLEALLAFNCHVSAAHFIDRLYVPEIDGAGLAFGPLRQMATWLQASRIVSFAYESLDEFLAMQPSGAHVVCQCDADFQGIDLSKATRPGGFHFWLKGEAGEFATWRSTPSGMELC